MKLVHKYPRQRGGPVAPFVPLIASAVGVGGGAILANQNKPKLPTPPAPPTQDTAANAAQQQALALRRRQGVMANIFGPNQQSAGGGNTQLGA